MGNEMQLRKIAEKEYSDSKLDRGRNPSYSYDEGGEDIVKDKIRSGSNETKARKINIRFEKRSSCPEIKFNANKASVVRSGNEVSSFSHDEGERDIFEAKIRRTNSEINVRETNDLHERRQSCTGMSSDAEFFVYGLSDRVRSSVSHIKGEENSVDYKKRRGRNEIKVRKIKDDMNALDQMVDQKNSAKEAEERSSREKLGYFYIKKKNDNLDIYEGEWKDGCYNGKGKYSAVSGWQYVGGWKDNLKHGIGTYTRKSGNVYEGEWKNGKRHGKGKYTRVNESIFEGEYKDDIRCGQGKITRTDGSSYEGGWKDDNMHGQGKFIFGDGYFYEGEYKNGKKDGLGRYANEDGLIYLGEYKNGVKHGKGAFSSPKGDIYEGGYKQGKKHGKGIIYRNGIFFRVQFEDGKQICKEECPDYTKNRQEKSLSSGKLSMEDGSKMSRCLAMFVTEKERNMTPCLASGVDWIPRALGLWRKSSIALCRQGNTTERQ